MRTHNTHTPGECVYDGSFANKSVKILKSTTDYFTENLVITLKLKEDRGSRQKRHEP